MKFIGRNEMKYFISYAVCTKDCNDLGFSNCIYDSKKEIKTSEDINHIQGEIIKILAAKTKKGNYQISIINFREIK